MSLEIFSAPWVDAWAQELRTSTSFRRAAAEWQGSLCLRLKGPDPDPGRTVLVDLIAGECRQVRVAEIRDLETVDYVLSAPESVWQRLLAGDLEPVWALMSGKLRLERGRLSGLMPHALAAKELVLAARRIEAPASAPNGVSTPSPTRAVPARPRFQTTSPSGLDQELFAMRLWQKAKRFGRWDPRTVDLTRDRLDWQSLSDAERDVLLRLTALFQAGEEAVALDLLPLIQVVAAEGRLEEEIYLASFLFDEAKHVEAFRCFLDEVASDRSDLSRYHTASYRRIFYRELPAALDRLRQDPSPEAQASAAVTYNMIVEGVLAETGYFAYYQVLERHRILPGMLQIVGHLRADEARHLAYGVYLLSRLVAEHGEGLWQVVQNRMAELLDPALEMIAEIFASYPEMPFGLELEHFTGFAQRQFERRVQRVEAARHRGLEETLYMRAESVIDQG